MLSIIAVNRRVASSNLARQRYWSNSLGQFESASLSNTLSIYRYLSPGPGTGNYTEIFRSCLRKFREAVTFALFLRCKTGNDGEGS